MPGKCALSAGTSPKSVCKDGEKARFRYLAEPFSRHDKLEELVARAARAIGVEYWRGYEIWYGRAKLTVEESDAIYAAAAVKRREADRNEFQQLKTRLAILESRLVQTDEEFHRETVSAMRGALRGRG